MKRIYISSIYRGEADSSNNDTLFTVDWETGDILASPEKPAEVCLMPIKGISKSYGTRGMAWYKDKLWVLGAVQGLLEIDPNTYNIIKTHRPEKIHHPHLMKVKDDLMWVTSTQRDSLVAWDGTKVVQERRIQDIPGIKELTDPYLAPSVMDRPFGADRLHFNSVAWDSDGNEYHTYMFCSAIFDVTNMRVVESGIPAPHDLEIRGNRLFYSASGDRSLFSLQIDGDRAAKRTCWMTREIPDSELEARKKYKGKTEFPFMALVRGIATSPADGLLFSAFAPGHLVAIDLKQRGKIVKEIKYCDSRHAQPFDILLDPRDW
jgi:hypothetical protein